MRRSRVLCLGLALAVAVVALPSLAVALTDAAAGGAVDEDLKLSVFDAVVLGLVEGLTEYLPVSSTGHLLVANELLGLNTSAKAETLLDTYAIGIQAGAILAVLVVYQERIRQMIDGLLGRSEEGRRVLIAVIVAFVPTAIIAQLLYDRFRDAIFGPGPIALAWFVGGLVVLALSRARFFDRVGIELADITMRQAFLIGVMQTVAVWPGTSRSLTTIIAGVLVGLSLRAAVEFSFLLGLITLSAATAYAALGDGAELIDTFGVVNPLIGLVVAFVSAVAAVRWMVTYLNEKGFEIFGWYRLAIGIAMFAAIGTGALDWS